MSREYNKPRVTLETCKDAEKFKKCMYTVKSVNDAYGALIVCEDGYHITYYGAPGCKKNEALASALDALREHAFNHLVEKNLQLKCDK